MYANLIIKTLSQIFSNTLLQFQIVLYTSIFLLKLCAVIYLYIFYLVINLISWSCRWRRSYRGFGRCHWSPLILPLALVSFNHAFSIYTIWVFRLLNYTVSRSCFEFRYLFLCCIICILNCKSFKFNRDLIFF